MTSTYPPAHYASNTYNPNYPYAFSAEVAEHVEYDDDRRNLSRTPSPTPSEREELSKKGLISIDWKKMKSMRSLDYWKNGRHIWILLLVILIAVIVILSIVFHTTIVNWLQPFAKRLHSLPAGFLIPIAILFVISFPPLFGHEIVAILCGLVWGLWPGFAIVAAGTLAGEWGNYYTFKFCCQARAEKMEKSTISYAALAKVIREGGFKIVVIVRYTVIPGHLTTALFSTCGIGFWPFTLSVILSLPKQLVTVYMGVLAEQSEDGTQSSSSKVASAVMIVVTAVVTILAMHYIRKELNKAKEEIVYARRKARQQEGVAAKLWDPRASIDSDLAPLNPKGPGDASRNSIPLQAPATGGSSYNPPSFSPPEYAYRPSFAEPERERV